MLEHVNKVNWAETSLLRCGILPLTKRGKRTFACIGVKKNTGCLSTLGGVFDPAYDFDLLDTAVREFHEETTNRLFPLTVESLYGDLCLISKGYALILHPVHYSKELLVEAVNKEVSFLVWTPLASLLSLTNNIAYDLRLFKKLLGTVSLQTIFQNKHEGTPVVRTKKTWPSPVHVQLTPESLERIRRYRRPWQKKFLTVRTPKGFVLRLKNDEKNLFYTTESLDWIKEFCPLKPAILGQSQDLAGAVKFLLLYEERDKQRFDNKPCVPRTY